MLEFLKFLENPNLINYVILVLFALATLRWGFHGNTSQTMYWAGAFLLNLGITPGIAKHLPNVSWAKQEQEQEHEQTKRAP